VTPISSATAQNFFFDALCVLIHVVFCFIPEYLLGPRLTPVFIAVMLIIHVLLPVMHIYSIVVVRSHERTAGLLDQERTRMHQNIYFQIPSISF
jgi:hypothetical protein